MNNEKGLNFDLVSKEVEVVPPPPDLPDLKTRALKILEGAKLIKIENIDDRIAAEAKLILVKKNMNSFKDLLNPGIDAQKSALNILKEKKREIMDPLAEAEGFIKRRLGDYYQREDAERRRLQAIEDRRIEEARLKEKAAMAAVIEAEEKGDMKKADEILKEQAEVETKTISIPPAARPLEKMKGISSRMIPKWEVTDPSKLPAAFRTIIPIRPKITGLIRAHGPAEAMRLCPGIRVWEVPSTTVKG